ncbi:MAG: hypothetical protein HC794_07970 [Nitrospiraceae bacterium]|nr:hypothetical protein [Nitrospiraceae bacterium]
MKWFCGSGATCWSTSPVYVPILGGTNDLGWNASPTEIMRNLVKMYEQTFAAGGLPIPVTVPRFERKTPRTAEKGENGSTAMWPVETS